MEKRSTSKFAPPPDCNNDRVAARSIADAKPSFGSNALCRQCSRKGDWPPVALVSLDSPARVSAPLHQGIKTTIAPAGNVEARA